MASHRSRRLAVIVHADVEGSTSLVQQDEALAHDRIQDAFRRFSETIEAHGGIAHELRGDALLAEFARASDAVVASMSFQADNAEHNDALEDSIRPEIRVGISLGEVVVADHTLTGPGVVLAQRLEQLAAAGGVCIQHAVYEAVPRRLPFDYRSLGARELKGFDEPVRAFAVTLEPGRTIPPPEPRPVGAVGFRRRRWAVVALVLALTAAWGLGVWLRPASTTGEGASGDRVRLALPDRPSIAVLPFEDLSGDPEESYFADGMTEDLITDLSKVAGLFVIARDSSFAYKGVTADVRRVAEELGVRFVLEGSVRRRDQRIRINAQLVDATSGGHEWAERYDGNLEDVFALQDKVTSKIVAALAVQLTTGDEERLARRDTVSTQAYDAFLEGWQHFHRQTPADFQRAIASFDQAVALDASYGRAHAALAATYWEIWRRLWHESVGLPRWHEARANAEAHLAAALESPTPLAHRVSAEMFAQMGEHDAAIGEAERAIALDPNDADGYVTLAQTLVLAGQAERALASVERAMRLNPHYPPSYLFQLGLAQFCMDRYAQAAATLEKAVALNPHDRWSLRLLLATYGQLDAADGVARVHETIATADTRGRQEYFDPLTVRSSAFWLRFKDPMDSARFADGLRMAGVPD